jgi:CelD/BcsL family acetyltransferase involved in cellulose biosynthesis
MSLASPRSSDLSHPVAGLVWAPEPVDRGLPIGATLATITSAAGLSGLEAQWRALDARMPAASLFQSFGWLDAWTRVYAGPGSHLRPFILTGHTEGNLVFLWPLMLQRLGPVKILRWMSEPLAQYGDVLLAPGQNPRAWLHAALQLIRRESGADLLWLRHVRADATAATFLAQAFRDSRQHDLAPVMNLTAFASEAAYEARYTASQRKRRKRIRKSIEEAFGPISLETLEPGPEQRTALATLLGEKRRWLSDRGRRNRAIDEARMSSFLQDLIHRAHGTVTVHVSQMSAGGRPMSWQVGLRKGTTHFGFITAHRNDMTDQSPARLHMDMAQRQALADGYAAFDLMVPNDPHKESWCSAKVPVRDHHLPLTPLGWAAGLGYLEVLRPLLRQAYCRMPPRLLQLLKPVTGH